MSLFTDNAEYTRMSRASTSRCYLNHSDKNTAYVWLNGLLDASNDECAHVNAVYLLIN